MTYVDSRLWNSVITNRRGWPADPRFCLFSSYGKAVLGSPNYSGWASPAILRPKL